MKYLFLTAIFAICCFQNVNSQPTSIKIGLLVQTNDQTSLSTIQSARLAIQNANDKGGLNGESFQLIVRSCEGSWGVTSKRVVSFAYEDGVLGIVTSIDGRNAHLAEQVATKTQIPLILTRATDPTLTQAYVPWFYRIVPNDQQQAEILARELLNAKQSRIGLLSAENYDSQITAQAIVAAVTNDEMFQIQSTSSFDFIMQQMDEKQIENLAIAGMDANTKKLIDKIIREKSGISILYIGPALFNDDLQVVAPVDWPNPRYAEFQNRFFSAYNYKPGLPEAYVYDAISLLLDAIIASEGDVERTKAFLKETDYASGITGEIRFDENGNRLGSLRLFPASQ